MGYLTNSGSGFLSNAVTTVSNVKSYLVNKTGYLVDSIRVGIGDFGQRVLDDGGTIEASAEAAASYREITKDIYDQASLVLFPSGYKDNLLYSHKPVNGSGDFTYTRGTDTATRVGADGYIKKERANLLLQSNQFDTTWTTAGASLTNGQSGYDGSSDAWLLESDSDGANRRVRQTTTASGISTFSVYAKQGSVDNILLYHFGANSGRYFDLNPSTTGSRIGSNWITTPIDSKIEDVGGGWFRCSIVVNASVGEAWIYPIATDGSTTTTAGDNIYIQDAQLEEGLVATTPYIETTTAPVYEGLTDNLPRIDYTGGTPSILLEPSRTNLVGQSEYIDSWNDYTNGNGATPTITTNYIESPEGIVNATRLQLETNGTSSTDASGVLQSIALDGSSTYIFSFWIKSNSGSSAELSTFINSSFGVQFTATTEWQRLDFEVVSNSTNPRNFGIVARGNYHQSVDVSFWGAQLEQGSHPTSYIPTYGSSATRAADAFNTLTYADNFNSLTFYAEVEMKDVLRDDITSAIRFGEQSGNNGSIRIFRSSAANPKRAVVIARNSSGSNVINYSVTQDRVKIKLTYDSSTGDWELFINGESEATGTSLDFNEFDTLEISGVGGQARIYKMYIKNSI